MPTVYVTVPRGDADALTATLLEEELAACVNRVDCHSQYRWEDDVVTDEEAILFIKTTDEAYDRLTARVREVHPHDVPCIERFDATDGHDPYRAWIRESVGSHE